MKYLINDGRSLICTWPIAKWFLVESRENKSNRTLFISSLNTFSARNHCALMMLSTTAESVIQSGEYSLRERPSPRLTSTVISATLTACLGAVSFGYVLGYPSPTLADFEGKLKWTSEQTTWFSVSLIYINNSWWSGLIFMPVVGRSILKQQVAKMFIL